MTGWMNAVTSYGGREREAVMYRHKQGGGVEHIDMVGSTGGWGKGT